jgi:hypothetical protein
MNRIVNYNNLRCKLCVKVILNGNGFHYGRAIMSYNPLWNRDEMTVDRAFFSQDIVAASQRPHIFLDPTTSQGGSMTLPFFWMYDYLNIPQAQWRDMGDMIIHTLQPLKHANGASDRVTVSIFAWAEDVVLATPTSSEVVGLVPQMGGEDEYGKGPISRPATAVARMAGKLKNIPVIGDYARATEMAASSVSSIASLFGMSRPVSVVDIVPMKPTFGGNLSNTNVGDSSQKLSLDVKQELCIDPRTVGLGDMDEMTITSIATRESYITNFPWAVGVAPETQLFTIGVNPCVWAANPITVPSEMHMTASCFAAVPFKHWRGSMKYRFQIVASAHHKGRLKIVWDPYRQATNEYNTNFTRIIDIADSTDFTVQIGWGNNSPYLDVAAPGDPTVSPVGKRNVDQQPYNNGLYNDFSYSFYNGYLSVYVVNELTVPNSTINNDIAVNVYVAAGEDIQFRNPNNILKSYTLAPSPDLVPQMGEELELEELDKPMDQAISQTMGKETPITSGHDQVFYGESITSFRALLKRYNHHSAVVWFGDAGEKLHQLTMCSFPLYSGYVPGAVYLRNGEYFTYANTTLLNYLTSAYGGYRGGLRWKYVLERSCDPRTETTTLELERDPAGLAPWRQITIPLPTGNITEWMNIYNIYCLTGLSGEIFTSTANNPVLEVEVPYQRPHRFTPGKILNYTERTIADRELPDFVRLQYHTNSNAADNDVLRMYNSVGEDFSLFFYLGPPRFFVNVVPP